jgi:hypothetical protein
LHRRFPSASTLIALVAGLTVLVPACATAPRLADGFVTLRALPGLHIVTPLDGSILTDGNLFEIQGLAVDASGGTAARVEIGFDFDDTWHATSPGPAAEPSSWSYVWEDPTPGAHLIRARAYGLGSSVAEQSVNVEVREEWSSAFAIDNPYATPGSFRKGQVHVHSTNSFDGWTSLPPIELAAEYKRRGYSFVAITDHDVISRTSGMQDETFALIPAYESTSESGHITALWVRDVVPPLSAPQVRLDHITAQGGMAILNHPGWRVGWNGADFASLKGYFGFEIYNGVTSTDLRAERNVQLWHGLLNSKGWANRAWAIAVDDAHESRAIDRGWVEVKVRTLSHQALRQALDRGAFYASNGPSFRELGISNGSITAASDDAHTLKFIDQDLKVLAEGAASGTSYRPKGNERWIRIEAARTDGRTAWSQPFWLLPNGTVT